MASKPVDAPETTFLGEQSFNSDLLDRPGLFAVSNTVFDSPRLCELLMSLLGQVAVEHIEEIPTMREHLYHGYSYLFDRLEGHVMVPFYQLVMKPLSNGPNSSVLWTARRIEGQTVHHRRYPPAAVGSELSLPRRKLLREAVASQTLLTSVGVGWDPEGDGGL